MTAALVAILGSLGCVVAVLFFGLTLYAIPRYRLALHGPAALASSMGLTAVGRTRNDAPFWYVGKMGDRPLAIAVAQNFKTNAWAPGRRSRRKSVPRIVVGSRAVGELFVWTGLPGNRTVKADGFDVEPLIALAAENGFGLTRAVGAPPELSPNATFANDWPALCWLDHPDIRLTDRREAAKLLDRLDRIVTRLESR